MQLINEGKRPEGVILSDLGHIAAPQKNIAEKSVCDKWESVPYETAAISGTMLSAFATVNTESVYVEPNLKGWYKIYVSMMDEPTNCVFLKLDDDSAQSVLRPSSETYTWTWWKWERFQEMFWKCADMTGQSIEISRRSAISPTVSTVAWFRFVPMSEEEISNWKFEEERSDTKRLFTTCDMYSIVGSESPKNHYEWRTIIENLKHSDTEILSIDEDIVPDNFEDTEHGDNYAFLSDVRKMLYFGMLKKTRGLYDDLIAYAHDSNLKIYLSKRMGAKLGAAYPYDGEYVNLDFGKQNLNLRCKNRDGVWVDSLSFAYDEVQNYMIASLVGLVGTNCDGITLIYTRGIPFVLFEDAVVKRFKEIYPEINPCELPLGDERINRLHCEIMTEFMRKLKKALNEECNRTGRKSFAVHAYVGSSLEDNRMIGLDVEAWAREGLIDSFSAYPLKITERLDNLMQEQNPKLIDLNKYKVIVREQMHKVIHRDVEYANHIERESVTEFVKMAKKYGVKVYFDILDRIKTSEAYEEDAATLIKCGAENFSLWDCDMRAEIKAEWETASRLGHLDELKNGTFMHNHATLYRILSIKGKNISLYNPTWFG